MGTFGDNDYEDEIKIKPDTKSKSEVNQLGQDYVMKASQDVRGKDLVGPKHIINIADLRCHLYMQSQVEPDMLPPTQAALDFKITRSHFVSKIWRNANDAVSANLIPNNLVGS